MTFLKGSFRSSHKPLNIPITPHKHLIFLNGYDLDVFPEDPFKFLREREGFIRSTPARYSEECKFQFAKEQTKTQTEQTKVCTPVEQTEVCTSVIRGELYSGKYASVFPGSLSTRSYLKIENALIERLLAFYLEPLQALLNTSGVTIDLEEIESLWRDLLKTQLHDNIGGVGADQIHDRMEAVYRDLYSRTKQLILRDLQSIPALLDLQLGKYVFMPSPFGYEHIWLDGHQKRYLVTSIGSGFYKIDREWDAAHLESAIDSYTWQNAYYTVVIQQDGIWFNGRSAGELLLEKDQGDTYNADPEQFVEAPKTTVTSLKLQEETEEFASIVLERKISYAGIVIRTQEELFMNNTPVLVWKISVDSVGKDYRLR
jgi:alpha-mannosidase